MHYAVWHLLIAVVISAVSMAFCHLVLGDSLFQPGPAIAGPAFYVGREWLDQLANGFWDLPGVLTPAVPIVLAEGIIWLRLGVPDAAWWVNIATGFFLIGGGVRQFEKVHQGRPGPSFIWRVGLGALFLFLAVDLRIQ